jgi:hypothetical protein
VADIELQLSDFLGQFINIESSVDSIAASNMKPSRDESMAITEIMDKPIEADEIPKIVPFLSEFLQCHLTKCTLLKIFLVY